MEINMISEGAAYHQQQQPKLKRSPYLASMCNDDTMMMVTPSSPTLVGAASCGAFRTLLSSSSQHDTLNARGGWSGATAATQNTKKGSSSSSKRNYSDFFELKRQHSGAMMSGGVAPPSRGGGKVRMAHRRTSMEKARLTASAQSLTLRLRGSASSFRRGSANGDSHPRKYSTSAAPTSLQYYYPNPFSKGNLLACLENGAITKNNSGNKVFGGDDENDNRSAGTSSTSRLSEDDDGEDKNMRMSHDNFTVTPRSQQEQSKQQRYRSLPVMNAGHRDPHSSGQFFPSVLDPIDGKEWDLNPQSRNEAWKEISISKDVVYREDAYMMDEDGDVATTVTSTVRHSSSSGGCGSSNKGSASLCSSDTTNSGFSDHVNYAAMEGLLAKSSARTAARTSPRSSLVTAGAPSTRRSLTVGAGLAYGRINDWHVRSRLSKD